MLTGLREVRRSKAGRWDGGVPWRPAQMTPNMVGGGWVEEHVNVEDVDIGSNGWVVVVNLELLAEDDLPC